MKNSMKIRVGLLVFILSLSGVCFGQKAADKKSTGISPITAVENISTPDALRIRRNRSLEFNNESKKAEIKINSTNEYNYLIISIHCQLKSGNAVLEIIDPKGDVRGTFKLKSDDMVISGDKTQTSGTVMGDMEKTMSKPKHGEWVIRATPSAAIGSVNVDITQGFEPRIDVIPIPELKD